ncbi:MAG: (Fe-S)-binding protein [Deltaproteobacteria bacterium]|nr:(Fe-S)-binding protein [Deltaproteobacteria bacterium]
MSVNLFIPCFIDQLAPEIGGSLADLLTCLEVPWEYPGDQTCCGQFALTVGDFPTARRLMRHFMRVFAEAEAIVCPSASCTLMVRRCYPKLAESLEEKRLAEKVAARTLELSEWLAAQGPLPWTPIFSGDLVLHHSCKARQLGTLAGASRLLAQVQGLTIKEVSPYYPCCGFGGAFKYQHPDIAQTIGEAYLEAVQETGARGVVSLDYSCLMHLRSVAAVCGLNLNFFHLAELVLPPRNR